MLVSDPVILGAYRTPLGRYGGALSSIRPDDMLAMLMRDTMTEMEFDAQLVDEIVIGCANQAGEDNRNIARMSTLLAGFPNSIPAITLNRLCASGLDAIIDGCRRIMTGEANIVVAGGVESMSRAPYVLAKARAPYQLGAPEIFDTSLGWRFYNDKMASQTPMEHNGVTAERLVEAHKISRERQDNFALRSHRRALKAQEDGSFDQEIIPLSLADKKIISKDEGPRADTNFEKLSSLKPAFTANGTVTAGNSSSLNDGASVVVLASHEYAKSIGRKPVARIIGYASSGVDPKIMGIGPVPATKKLLKSCKLSVNDFSSIEINEAFAAQVLSVIDLLRLDEEKVNPRGGAIALGHPLGCSGARIVTTLLHHLQTTQGGLGLASLCVGVGQGVSMAVELIS